MSSYSKAKARGTGKERFVSLPYYLLNSKAFNALSFPARAAYIEFKKRYNGSNNGTIGFAIRDLAKVLNCAHNTASKAIDDLTEKGFIRCSQKGAFNVKHRLASTYILTEYDYNNKSATKDYMRWEEK